MTRLVLITEGPIVDTEKGVFKMRYSVRIDSDWKMVEVECSKHGELTDRRAATAAVYALMTAVCRPAEVAAA